MKLHRLALLAAVAAFGAAGCSDDNSVATPDTPPPALIVALTPSSQAVAVGGVADFAAGVSGGDAALAATWTCQSSNTATASVAVTATGCRATGVAAGNATVTISVTKGTQTSNAGAGITVTSVVTTPATVLISAINQGGLPAPIGGLAGQLDVVLNIERGTEILQKVDLLDGTTVVASQTLAAGAPAAQDGPAADGIQQITLSFNTACYTDGTANALCGTVNATAGTATIRTPNGLHSLSAKLTVSGGATSLRSSNSVALTYANASGVHIAAVTLPTNSQLDAAGLKWYGGPNSGPIIFTAVPVSFGGGATTAVSATLCGVTIPLTAAPFKFTFASALAAVGLTPADPCFGFSNAQPPAAPSTPVFTLVVGGNAVPAGILNPVTSSFPIRIDDLAPISAPTFVGNPNVRQNGWINGTTSLVGLNEFPDVPTTPATPNGWVANGAGCPVLPTPCDAGVGGYVRKLRIGASGAGALSDVATALAATASATPTLPAPSADNMSYCAIVSATDLLGNETALPVTGTACRVPDGAVSQVATASIHQQFGVDTTAPTIALCLAAAAATQSAAAVPANCPVGGVGISSGAGTQRVATATLVGEFRVTVSDVGGVGNSGMLSSSAVVGTVKVARSAGAGVGCVNLTTGAIVTVSTLVPCVPASVNALPGFPEVATTVVGAEVVNGFYFYRAYAQDAAGNQSAEVTRVVAHDDQTVGANLATLTTASYNLPLSAGLVTFNAFSNDDLDLRDVKYTLTYNNAALAGPFLYPTTTLHALPAATVDPATVTFVNTNQPIPVTVASFVRRVEPVTSAFAGPLTLGAAGLPTTLTPSLRDQAGPAIVAPATTLTGTVTPGVSYLPGVAGQVVNGFQVTAVPSVSAACGTASCVSTGDAILGTTPQPASYPTSVVVNADVTGPTATFSPPFTRVDFYAVVGANLELIGSSTTPVTTDNGAANGRQHRYSLTWTPAVASPISATNWLAVAVTAVPNTGTSTRTIYAVGVNAAGDALVTAANATITIARP